MNKSYMLRLFLSGIAIAGLLLVGCAQSPKKTVSSSKEELKRPPVVTVSTKPNWLLIGGVDVPESVGGDRIYTPHLTLFGYEIRSYGKEQITFTFYTGGKIIYWRGKGEITNLSTGERVLVPIAVK